MRSVEYTLEEDDLVAFGMLSLRVSPVFHRAVKRMVAFGCLLVAVCAVLLMLTGRERWPAATLLIVGLPMVLTLTPPLIWRRMPSVLRRQLSASRNRSLLGKNRLELLDDGVKRTHEKGEAKVAWSGVERLIAGRAYLALYIAANQAFIVPRRAFTQPTEEAAFRAEVEQRSGGRFVDSPY